MQEFWDVVKSKSREAAARGGAAPIHLSHDNDDRLSRTTPNCFGLYSTTTTAVDRQKLGSDKPILRLGERPANQIPRRFGCNTLCPGPSSSFHKPSQRSELRLP